MKPFLLSLALISAAGCASSPPQQQTTPAAPAPASFKPSYGFEMGSSPVGVIPAAILHDAARKKDLEVSIEYPARGSGPFPVIILSHGYGGSSHGYEGLISYWTSYGYVCIRPSHADAGALRDAMSDLLAMRRDQRQQANDRGRNRKPADANANANANAHPRPNAAEMIWEKEREPQWRDRVRDVTLILDSLDQIEKDFPELAGKMDHSRIGVGGHSYGAFTATLVAGGRTFGDPPLELGDPRVKAMMAMSPQGVAANRGLTADSWRDVHVPAMYMTGSRDFGANESEGPEWRRTAFDNSPPGDKYFVLIKGATHMTFTGVATGLGEQTIRTPQTPVTDPRTGQVVNPGYQPDPRGLQISDRGTFNTIRSVSLMFWDSYLKDKKEAKVLLDPTKFSGSVELVKK
jgi:predicted dienelactone hydrolase